MSARSSILGFLLGTTLAGSGLYYYVVDEYKVSNELLTEDIYVRGQHESCSMKWWNTNADKRWHRLCKRQCSG